MFGGGPWPEFQSNNQTVESADCYYADLDWYQIILIELLMQTSNNRPCPFFPLLLCFVFLHFSFYLCTSIFSRWRAMKMSIIRDCKFYFMHSPKEGFSDYEKILGAFLSGFRWCVERYKYFIFLLKGKGPQDSFHFNLW